MSLTDQINADIKQAMLNKEPVKLTALRAIKSALMLEATKDGSGEVSEEAGMKILNKLYKQRKESAQIYQDQDREDLANEELAQAEIIENYLPKQLSKEEITSIVNEIVSSTGATSMADMGKVMGAATQRMAGQADGKLISEIVRGILG